MHQPRDYQSAAYGTQVAVMHLLEMILAQEKAKIDADGGAFNIGAIVSGAIGGVVNFAACGELDQQELRGVLVKALDTALPQIYMGLALGGAPAGRA